MQAGQLSEIKKMGSPLIQYETLGGILPVGAAVSLVTEDWVRKSVDWVPGR